MRVLRGCVLAVAIVALTVGPALAKGGGGGGGGGAGGGGGGNGGGVGQGQGGGVGHGGGVGLGIGHGSGPPSGHTVGAGRDTAASAPGSRNRSETATGRLSTAGPGKASPGSGVSPGFGRVGTVPTTPGHQAP